MREAIRRAVKGLFPELGAGLHLDRYARVLAVADAPGQGAASERFRPRYAVDIQILTADGEPDPAFPTYTAVPLPVPTGAGQEKGFFSFPEPGAQVVVGFAYGRPDHPIIRQTYPLGVSLPEVAQGEQLWQSTPAVYQRADAGGNWTRATEAKIEEKILSGETIPVATRGEIGVLHHGLKQSKLEYIHHLTTTIDSDLSGLRVLVDCANGAASATAPELFGRFKCYADFIHREPNGTNINDRCGSTHLESLGQRVVAGKYDVGVAFDGDADRCLMVDELGHEIDGDKIMAVCGAYMKRNGRLTGNTIVATVMSNLGLHEFCRKNGIDLVCTNVGDRNVLEKMVECGYKLGGEQSGHMIFTDYATTGDGQLSALQFLQILALSGKSASVLTADCPQYPQVLLNVVVSHDRGVKEAIMASDALKTAVADEEKFLRGEGRILVRPSGTEALIRVMVEAKTESVAQLVAERLVKVIRSV